MSVIQLSLFPSDKTCRKCNISKPVEEFNHGNSKDGLTSYCKECMKESNRIHYPLRRDKYSLKAKVKTELQITAGLCQVRYCSEKPCPGNQSCKKHAEEALSSGKRQRIESRKLVISHYGGKCNCCGESIFEFLQIDHINGGGRKHRAEVGSGTKFYRWLIRNGFPDGFQVLCANCNFGKGQYGTCPHAKVVHPTSA